MPGERHDNPEMMTRWGLVNLYDPLPEQFDIEGIARTLSHQHRYVGNYGPYSVAQHAVAVAQTCRRLLAHDDRWCHKYGYAGKKCIALAALHHDDAEAVTGDFPSPLKREIKADSTNFRTICGRIERAIEAHLGLAALDFDHPAIKEADLLVFLAETRILTPADRHEWYTADVEHGIGYLKAYQPTYDSIVPWPADKAFAEYMYMHEGLLNDR